VCRRENLHLAGSGAHPFSESHVLIKRIHLTLLTSQEAWKRLRPTSGRMWQDMVREQDSRPLSGVWAQFQLYSFN